MTKAAEENKTIRIAFKLDPFVWIGQPYCKVQKPSQPRMGFWCTREEGHSGPHICTVHNWTDATSKIVDRTGEVKLECIWRTKVKNPKRYEDD